VSYAIKLGAYAIGFVLLGFVIILIFDAIWFRIGFGAAAVLVFGALALWAWRVDRKEKARRADLPPI
jgi:hypothetical protein